MQELIRETTYQTITGKQIIEARYSRFNYTCFSPHLHNTFSIAVILDGAASVSVNNKRYTAEKGDIVIINPGQVHCCNPEVGSLWTYYMYYIDAAWFMECAKQYADLEGNFKLSFKEPLYRNKKLFNRFKPIFSLFENSTALEIEEELFNALGELFTTIDLKFHVSPGQLKESKEYVSKAQIYFKENYTERITLQELSQNVGLSPFHLLRIFKAEAGLPPHAYLMRYRIERSKELILARKPLAEVALECGFSDQSHFIKRFKEFAGCTPGEYLQSR